MEVGEVFEEIRLEEGPKRVKDLEPKSLIHNLQHQRRSSFISHSVTLLLSSSRQFHHSPVTTRPHQYRHSSFTSYSSLLLSFKSLTQRSRQLLQPKEEESSSVAPTLITPRGVHALRNGQTKN